MKILYATFHPLPLSESYIRNEIEWMEEQGLEIAIWAEHPRLAVGYDDPGRKYWIGKERLGDALESFQPNIVHAHPIFIGQKIVDEVGQKSLPLTVRGHVGFGGREANNVQLTRNFASEDSISRIWAFPHIADDVAHPKVVGLPVCYAPEFFHPGEPSNDRFILRIGTALPGKGWEEFVEIARMCPELPFVAALAVPIKEYANCLIRSGPRNLTFHQDLERSECASLMKSAWVYLRGHDLSSHRYGMPISIAEALGCGLPVIARNAQEPRKYMGPAGI
jgi:glycosyltransferase involved in cell wall biosynthesis